jgi:hypothetical protein
MVIKNMWTIEVLLIEQSKSKLSLKKILTGGEKT